jgi:drug/metabolite transporter (DMT)-like permease
LEFNNLKAALFVVIAMSMITTNDAIVKHITQVFNVGQIMFLRGAIICLIFALVMKYRRQPVFNRQTLHRWNLLRAVASTLGFASPIFLALLAALTNPFAESASGAVIFPVICAFFVALRDIAIRFVPHDIASSQVAFTNAWIVMLGGGLYSLYQGWGEAELSWYLWFFGLGAVLYCGYLFLIIGSRLGELSFISPFKYISILIAIVYGYLIWGDKPTLTMIAGATIIVVSGIILVSTEKKRNRVASLLPEAAD